MIDKSLRDIFQVMMYWCQNLCLRTGCRAILQSWSKTAQSLLALQYLAMAKFRNRSKLFMGIYQVCLLIYDTYTVW